MYIWERTSELAYFESVNGWTFIAIPFASRASSLVASLIEYILELW